MSRFLQCDQTLMQILDFIPGWNYDEPFTVHQQAGHQTLTCNCSWQEKISKLPIAVNRDTGEAGTGPGVSLIMETLYPCGGYTGILYFHHIQARKYNVALCSGALQWIFIILSKISGEIFNTNSRNLYHVISVPFVFSFDLSYIFYIQMKTIVDNLAFEGKNFICCLDVDRCKYWSTGNKSITK